jgi:putative spermidine/putrescine transport system substrate-binding protein
VESNVGLTRSDLLTRGGIAAVAAPLAGSRPFNEPPRPGGSTITAPLRVSTIGIEWPDGVHQQAQLDLGFPIQLEPLTSILQVENVLSKPESFDVFGGYSYQAMRVWFSGHLRPVDTRRIAAWPDLYALFTRGKLVPGSACRYGVGDAPFRSLFLRAGTTGLPVSSARPPRTQEIVQWIDERTGQPHGARPMPRYVVGVPAHFSAESIGYLVSVIPKSPARVSWAELLNRSWKGRVGMQNDPAVGLIDLGRAVEALGIMPFRNLGQMTIPEIDRLVKILTLYRKQGQFRAAWSGFNDSVNLMASKDVAIAPLWPSAVARVAAEGVRIAYAVPPEGYRGSCSSVGISSRVTAGTRLDACYAYLNWLHQGFFGAEMMRQGYYVANGARLPEWIETYGASSASSPFSPDEYRYWYEGRRAARALPDVKGTLLSIRRGALREGGSLAARMCRCTTWSSYFPAAAYQTKRFGDFLTT